MSVFKVQGTRLRTSGLGLKSKKRWGNGVCSQIVRGKSTQASQVVFGGGTILKK